MGILIARRIGLCFLFLLFGMLFVSLSSTQLFAQDHEGTKRSVATAPEFEVSAGYVYMSMTSPSASRLGLNGVDATGTMQFTPRWGATADFTFATGSNVAGTGRRDNVFSGLVGPVFYLLDSGKNTVFIHGLFGMGIVDSAVPINSATIFKGYETRFSYAFGGGWERSLSGPFAVRIGGDYQRTSFVNSTLALEGQNNIRVTTSLVYRFGNR